MKQYREGLLEKLVLVGAASSVLNLPLIQHISMVFAFLVGSFSIYYLLVYILLKKGRVSYDLAADLSLIMLFIQILIIPVFSDVSTLFIAWVLIYPVVVFSLKPSGYALRFSIFLYAMFLFIYSLSCYHSSYTIENIITFTSLYIAIVVVFYAMNLNVEEKEKILSEQNMRLSREKELYDMVFENSSSGVLTLDIETGCFTRCNNKIVEMLKYKSKSDILNLHPSELSPKYQPDGQKSFEKANKMIALALEKGSKTFDWKHIRANGEEFWSEITLTSIVVDGKNIIHVIWKDIDARKRSRLELESINLKLADNVKKINHALEIKNKKLQESINNFQSLLDATMEMIILIDEKGNIVDINQSGIEMLGYKNKHDIINTSVYEYVLKSEIEKHENFNLYDEVKLFELLLVKKDKKILPTLVSSKEILIDNRSVVMLTLMDLTEIKQKEKLLQQQSRLAQMGEMINMIAHQWRQPLSAISSSIFSIMLKQKSGKFDFDNKQDREIFLNFISKKHNNINKYVQVLSDTIDDFRNFFKPDKSKELLDITIPIKRALDIVENSLRSKNIKVDIQYEDIQQKYIYQNEMMQVILNILKNAEDNFIERKISDGKIFIKTFMKDSYAVIQICDNGGGITDSVLPNIFDPYFSTKDEKNGTGLGLYMSKIIVEEHNGGSLNVYNTKSGVCFEILI